jgi:hypothetical protein
MYQRLRLSRIERKKKRVRRHEHFDVRCDLDDDHEAAFIELVRCITNGERVPERFYRAGINSDTDELLERTGIMHLHLGHPGTEQLIFLVQYEDDVVLLEINDHKHFRTEPNGALLQQLFQMKLREWEQAEDARRAAAKAAEDDRRRAEIRDALKKSGLK